MKQKALCLTVGALPLAAASASGTGSKIPPLNRKQRPPVTLWVQRYSQAPAVPEPFLLCASSLTFAHLRLALFAAHPVVQDLPDHAAEAMGNGPDRFLAFQIAAKPVRRILALTYFPEKIGFAAFPKPHGL